MTQRQMTYEELVTSVRHVRCGLYKQGLLKGDVVLILLPNCIEYPVILHAIVSLGGIVTASSPSVTIGEFIVRNFVLICHYDCLIFLCTVLGLLGVAMNSLYF